MRQAGTREGWEGERKSKEAAMTLGKGRTQSHPHTACTLGLRWLSAAASLTLHFRDTPVIIGTLRPVFLQLGSPATKTAGLNQGLLQRPEDRTGVP